MSGLIATVSTDNIEKLNEAMDKVATNPGMLKTYLLTLPQKGFDLAIKVLFTALLVVVGLFVTKALRKMLSHALDKAGVEKGTKSFIDSVVKTVCYLLLLMLILVRFGVAAATIVALIGSLGLTVGLALQGTLQNFASGILILVIKPYRVGDFIKETSHGNEGVVEDIGLVYTKVGTVDGKDVFIPNSSLASNPIVNYTKNGIRTLSMSIGVSYAADLKKAQEIISLILKDYDINSAPTVFVESFADSSVIIRFRAQVFTDRYGEIAMKVNEEIKAAFDKERIEIPFTQIDVHMK